LDSPDTRGSFRATAGGWPPTLGIAERVASSEARSSRRSSSSPRILVAEPRGPVRLGARRPDIQHVQCGRETANETGVRGVLLGAGASRTAGYPRAGELLPTIATYAERSRSVQLRTAWGTWTAYRDSMDGALRELLNDPNPEVVFSTLDLLQLGRGAGLA